MITSFSSVIVVVLPCQWNLFVSENNDFPKKHLFVHDLIYLLTIGYSTFSVNGIVDDDICISSEINYLHNYSLSFVVNNSCKFGQVLKMGWKTCRLFFFFGFLVSVHINLFLQQLENAIQLFCLGEKNCWVYAIILGSFLFNFTIGWSRLIITLTIVIATQKAHNSYHS